MSKEKGTLLQGNGYLEHFLSFRHPNFFSHIFLHQKKKICAKNTQAVTPIFPMLARNVQFVLPSSSTPPFPSTILACRQEDPSLPSFPLSPSIFHSFLQRATLALLLFSNGFLCCQEGRERRRRWRVEKPFLVIGKIYIFSDPFHECFK